MPIGRHKTHNFGPFHSPTCGGVVAPHVDIMGIRLQQSISNLTPATYHTVLHSVRSSLLENRTNLYKNKHDWCQGQQYFWLCTAITTFVHTTTTSSNSRLVWSLLHTNLNYHCKGGNTKTDNRFCTICYTSVVNAWHFTLLYILHH